MALMLVQRYTPRHRWLCATRTVVTDNSVL